MAALYRAADIMVVTPFRDGMNLVAKEYVACRFDDDGALVLSEFAGAADELRQAYLINPYDINGMKVDDARGLPGRAQGPHPADAGDAPTVADNDVAHWASTFLDELGGKRSTHSKSMRPARSPDRSS